MENLLTYIVLITMNNKNIRVGLSFKNYKKLITFIH
jgi:hypothetical protein